MAKDNSSTTEPLSIDDFVSMEHNVLKFWKEQDIFNKVAQQQF